ncbi:hypothetical protein [Pseudomonas lactis]|uniref:hypothetical protein n=1 Tax=Pseudomonas lactis TaxID=1615674 RepID=UPI003F822B48
MKPTKRAKKNQARQKLKLESERITKDETQKNEVAADSDNCRSEIGVLIMAIVFSPIMLFLIYCSGNQFDDVYQRQIENRKAEHTETVSKNAVGSLVDSFIGNEPLNETKSENPEYASIKKHQIERIKIDNFTYPTVTQVLERVFERVFYTSENRSANHKTIKQEVQIPRDEIIENGTEPANEDYETILSFDKNLLVVVEEKSKTHTNNSDSKDEITENLKKESAFLLASENTDEGKLRNAFSESENEINANEDEKPSPIVALLKILFLFLLLFLVSFPSTVKSILYKALSKDDLTSPKDMESEKKAQPKFVLKISDSDDAKYSNKL